MARLYQKRGIWYAWGYTASGKRWIKTTRQRDRRVAVVVARKLEHRIASADDSAHPTATLGEAVTALLAFLEANMEPPTVKNNRAKAGHLVRLIGADADIATIDSEKLSAYTRDRIAEGAQRSTIHVEVAVLKSALRVAARAKRWRGDTRALEVPELAGARKPRRTWALPQALARLVAATPEQWREHVEVWSGAGLRRMELYRIEAHDVDRAGNRVHVRGTKTDAADRWVPMTPRVRSILLRRARTTPTGPLFNEWTRAHHDIPAACERAGIQRLMVSDLRRTFASNAISNGVSASVLKELMGHTTTKQIDLVYGHASERAKQDAVRAVARAVARGVTRKRTNGAKDAGRRRKKR